MNSEPTQNKIRTSVLVTTIIATIFAMVMLFLYPPRVMSGVGLESNGLDSPTILIEAVILVIISLLGSLFVILKTKYV